MGWPPVNYHWRKKLRVDEVVGDLLKPLNSEYEDNASRIMWKLKIPPRAAAFSWRIFKDRLPTKANLRRR